MSQYDMGDAERDARGLAPLHSSCSTCGGDGEFHGSFDVVVGGDDCDGTGKEAAS